MIKVLCLRRWKIYSAVVQYALDWIGMYCIHAELQFPLNFWNDAFYLFTVIAIVVYKKN